MERPTGPSPNKRQTALITGASAGIGYEFARVFAREGHALVLVARNKEKLDQIARELKDQFAVSVRVMPQDLSQPGAPEEIFRELQKDSVAVDILVNNAGFGGYGFFFETGLKPELEMLQVNAAALTHLTKLFLKGMVERKRGKILNVASTAAFQPGPLMAVYFATKAYVLSFSEALANELKGTGVGVTVLCPGATQSEFQQRAGIERMKLLKAGMMDAETVAKAGYRGMMQNKTVVIPGIGNNIFAFLIRLGPRSWVTTIVRFLQEKTKQSHGG